MLGKLFTAIVFCFLSLPGFAAERPVALELVLAIDTSSSVDNAEFELQRDGISAAFEHPDLISIIEGLGDSGIAIMVVAWAGNGEQQKLVDWTLLTSRATSLDFSQKLKAAPRNISGSTDIGSVIDYSVKELENNPYKGNRSVIDISGDGASSSSSPEFARDRAILKNVTINGLVILSDLHRLSEVAEVDLIRHYLNKVIGGNGAFLLTAQGFEDFRHAILKKLIREILGTGTAGIGTQFIPQGLIAN